MIQNPYFVYINSRDRISGTDENFTYNIQFPEGTTFDRVVCLNCLIPKSYYLIQDSSQERTFQLKENDSTVSIMAPTGSYLLQAFKKTISELLTANSPNGLTYTLSYPALNGPDNGKWTFTQTNGAIQSSIIVNSHFFEPFGFFPDSKNDFQGTTLVSSTVIKLQSEDRLLLHSNCVENGRDDILVSINASSSINYSSIAWECSNPEYYSHILNSQHNNTYSFSLTDEDNELIELNGLNMNISLLFYHQNPIYEQITNVLKLFVAQRK